MKVTVIYHIWQTMYGESNFTVKCKRYDCELNRLFFHVTEHARRSLYSVIAMDGAKHMFVATTSSVTN